MSAYVVFQSTVKDAAKLSAYAARALPTVAAHGGRRLSSGGLTHLHGDEAFAQGAIFQFQDGATARAWHGSSEYQDLQALRGEAMDCSITMIDDEAG